MNDRQPSFKLVTQDGNKPYADGDRAQAKIVDSLQLRDKCQRDPSLVVVDVGAFLGNHRRFSINILIVCSGEFGLYAAACGCRVHFFEVQPDMAALIRTSIVLNNFSSSRVQLLENAISDLPSNSLLTFTASGGSTSAGNGSLRVSTIRLDDVSWPPGSKILLLKIDVEGFELNALRSAEKLFREKRVHHLIFEYTAWWTNRAAQKELIPYVQKALGAKKLFALDRTGVNVFGPLTQEALNQFHENHIHRRLQTDIYATFCEPAAKELLQIQPYDIQTSFA